MGVADIFSRMASALFGAEQADAAIDQALLDEAVEAIVEAVEPRLRLVPRYQRKLAPVVVRTIRCLRALVPALPSPIELSRPAWRADASVNALFAKADDIDVLLSATTALRGFFGAAENVGCEAAYGVLGVQRQERRVFASALVDGEVRSDVAQTTVSFAEHRLVAIAADAIATRRLLGKAILERIAAIALERIVATRERATALDTRASLLATRRRMLTLRQGGLHELTPGERDPALELASVEAELAALSQQRRDVKASLATLDYSIEAIEAVFGEPERHVGIDSIALRVSHTGYKLDCASSAQGNTLRLSELWIGTGLRAVIVPVCVPRAALPLRWQ